MNLYNYDLCVCVYIFEARERERGGGGIIRFLPAPGYCKEIFPAGCMNIEKGLGSGCQRDSIA